MAFYIGLMSGTSADAIDAALVDFSEDKPRLIASHSLLIPSTTKQEIFDLFTPGANEIDRLGVLDRRLGHLFAQAANELIAQSGVTASQIKAIGSHGQTLRHRPRLSDDTAFTLQIGDPNTIAELTGITTIADFRRRDLACRGQGAPLAPAFHQAIFASTTVNRGVLNLGGIANITYLSVNGDCQGFDTGPANGLMDYWIFRCCEKAMDTGGNWAATGTIQSPLLNQLKQHPFLGLAPPKSTGKEEFTSFWLEDTLNAFETRPSDADVQATLLEFTASTVSEAIERYCPNLNELYVCGGGAMNRRLLNRLQELLPRVAINTTAVLGVDAQWVEAMAFAWLAMRRLQGLHGNLPSVTGADRYAVLGAVYPAI